MRLQSQPTTAGGPATRSMNVGAPAAAASRTHGHGRLRPPPSAAGHVRSQKVTVLHGQVTTGSLSTSPLGLSSGRCQAVAHDARQVNVQITARSPSRSQSRSRPGHVPSRRSQRQCAHLAALCGRTAQLSQPVDTQPLGVKGRCPRIHYYISFRVLFSRYTAREIPPLGRGRSSGT